MNTIKINKINDRYNVEVSTNYDDTTHIVTINKDYFKDALGNMSEEELVKRSFEFLLERELNTSILKEFDLKDISNYFPEYQNIIK